MTLPLPQHATASLPDLGSAISTGATPTAPLGAISNTASLPTLNVAKKIKIPNGVSSNAKQHVVLALDKSLSMGGHKIDELNLAVSGLIHELASPINKDGFLISIVEFNHGASRCVFAESAITLIPPSLFADGSTNFNAALEETVLTIEAFKAVPNPDGWRYLRPQVLFLSDGQSQISDKKINDLQEIANVWAIAYGDDADTSTLAHIASDGQAHLIGMDGGALRAFLAKVGETLSQDLAKAT